MLVRDSGNHGVSDGPSDSEQQHGKTSLMDNLDSLRLFIEYAPAAIAMFDRDMHYLAVSERWKHDNELLEDIVGRSHYEVSPNLPERWKDALRRALAGEVLRVEQDSFPRRDGSARWIRWEARPWYVDSKIGGILIETEEVTQSVLAKERLQEKEERFRAFVNATSDVVYRMNPDWTVMSHLEGKEFIADQKDPSRTWLEKYIHPDDRTYVMSAIDAAIRSKSVFELEHRVLRVDGTIGWTFSRAIPIFGAAGEILEWFGAAADITKRKRAEEKLRESEQQFLQLAESIPQLAWMANPDGWIFWYNQRWFDYTGTTLEEMQGWGWKKVHHPQHVDRVVGRISQSWETGVPWEDTFPLRARDGKYRWFLSRAVPLRDHDGRILRWFGTNTDVTEQREAEDRLRWAEKLAATGQLASALAHEINNPLAAVTNTLYLLERHPDLRDDAKGLVTTAASELDRVSRIVKHSLSYYRVDAVAKDLDLSAVAEESTHVFSEKMRRAGIQLIAKITPDLHLIGFANEIRQVIDNLLLNAFEATPRGGRVVLSLRRSPNPRDLSTEGVRLTIADTGAGMPQDYRSQVFQPFFTTKQDKGAGLGLWVVRGIVAKHDGQISISSAKAAGRCGTAVSIFWPPLG